MSSSAVINYEHDLARISPGSLYYHITPEEKRKMFPVDPNLTNRRPVTSSWAQSRQPDFHEEVAERDNMQCVVTNSERSDAVHLIPHSKSDMYIERLTKARRLNLNDDGGIIQQINDARNGLFVNKMIHDALGEDLAFLKTPNFAMKTTDIIVDVVDPDQERFTYHLFGRSDYGLYPGLSGSAIRVPSDKSMWPPTVLFDAVYASMVLRNFGKTKELDKWKDVFSPSDDRRNQSDADKKQPERRKSARDKRAEKRDSSRPGDSAMDAFDILTIFPYMAMGPTKMKAYLEQREEKKTAEERKVIQEKVNSWRQDVA